MATCASTIGMPSFSNASLTALKSSGAVSTSKLSSSSAKSSAPASKAIIIKSSASISHSSLSMIICPFLSNMQDTEPGVPMFPFPFVKALLTFPAVRFLLSVSVSTIIATPLGP